MSTRETLVAELRKLPRTIWRDVVIRRAERGSYHDFDSHLALPKVELVRDLDRAGFRGLAERARAGEFDERPSAGDVEQFRNWIGPDIWDSISRQLS